jgi:hypothetical protein
LRLKTMCQAAFGLDLYEARKVPNSMMVDVSQN